MSAYDHLSSEELFAVRDRQIERVADCLSRTEGVLQRSARLLRSSAKLLEQKPRVPRVLRRDQPPRT